MRTNIYIYISFADFGLLCKTEHTKMALFFSKKEKNVLTNSIDNYSVVTGSFCVDASAAAAVTTSAVCHNQFVQKTCWSAQYTSTL